MFWIGVAIGCMVGSLMGVAYVSMVVIGKQADERTVWGKRKDTTGRLTGRNKHRGYITTTSSKGGIGVYDAVIEKLFAYEETGLSPNEVIKLLEDKE